VVLVISSFFVGSGFFLAGSTFLAVSCFDDFNFDVASFPAADAPGVLTFFRAGFSVILSFSPKEASLLCRGFSQSKPLSKTHQSFLLHLYVTGDVSHSKFFFFEFERFETLHLVFRLR